MCTMSTDKCAYIEYDYDNTNTHRHKLIDLCQVPDDHVNHMHVSILCTCIQN